MCQQLVERHFGHNVKRGESEEFKDDDSVYQFIEDVQANALNGGIKTQCEPRPGMFKLNLGYPFLHLFLRQFISEGNIIFVIVRHQCWQMLHI